MSTLAADRDYTSPGLTIVTPDDAFPRMRPGDRRSHHWKYLRREVPHHWYADERYPEMGFLNRDEATLLHNIALSFAGKPALEIGSWLGWSTCHLALAGVALDVIDPAHDDPALRAIVDESLARCGVAERVFLAGGRSPGTVAELAARRGRPWSLFFIDGDHEGPAPWIDARACLPHAAHDCAFVFHDLASPAVADGLRFLEAEGFQVLVYQTTQIMGVAWRGDVVPPSHVPDPEVAWQLPHHLADLPVSGVTPRGSGRRDLDRLLAPAARPRQAGARPSVCIVSSEVVGLFKNGGIGTSMTGLAEHLASSGFPVTVLYTGATSPEELARWRARYAELGITLEVTSLDVPVAGPLGERGFVQPYLVYRYLAAHPFDVIHFNDCLGDGHLTLAAKRLGLAFARSLLVVALHSPSQWVFELNQTLPSNLLYAAFNQAERTSVACADLLWGPSRYLLDWANQRGFHLPSRAVIQPYIMPSARLRAEPAPPPAAPADNRPPVELVFFGRLEERKGLRLFCNAIDAMRGTLAERAVTVTFLGKPETCGGMPSLEYIAQRSAAWRFPVKTLTTLGQPEAIAYLKAGGKLAIMPSPADNAPCTVTEALLHGIPFVAARTGGIPELIDARDQYDVLFDHGTHPLVYVLERALASGTRVARPALTQDEIRRRWTELHEGWRELVDAARPPRGASRPVIAVVDHRPGCDLEATLASLRGEVRRVVILDRGRTAGQLAGDALRVLSLLDDDPQALREELAGFAHHDVLLVHAGVTLRPGALRALAAALPVDGVDGLAPAAAIAGSPEVVPPLGGGACFSLFEGATFTGALLVRGETLASSAPSFVAESPFLGLADACVARGARILPYPEIAVERPRDLSTGARGALAARAAIYGEAPPWERYYMLAMGLGATGAAAGPATPRAARRLIDVGLRRVVRLGAWSLGPLPAVKARLKQTRAFRMIARLRDGISAP